VHIARGERVRERHRRIGRQRPREVRWPCSAVNVRRRGPHHRLCQVRSAPLSTARSWTLPLPCSLSYERLRVSLMLTRRGRGRWWSPLRSGRLLQRVLKAYTTPAHIQQRGRIVLLMAASVGARTARDRRGRRRRWREALCRRPRLRCAVGRTARQPEARCLLRITPF
jgi:hypothetical protein